MKRCAWSCRVAYGHSSWSISATKTQADPREIRPAVSQSSRGARCGLLRPARIEFDDFVGEIADQEIGHRPRVPIEAGTDAVTQAHRQHGSPVHRTQFVPGLAQIEIVPADAHVIIERAGRK